jgi:hypothetical protein
MSPPEIFIEIGQSSLKALRENDGMELPLERLPDGRLTVSCKEKIIAALKHFLRAKSWQPRVRAVCAIGARGVLLRKLSLPAGTKEEFHKRLLLQIEGEFPLPPDELAWGWRQLGEPKPTNGTIAKSELLVAAVKKEVVADYQEILNASGMNPIFTLAALARDNLCPQPLESYAMLDIGNDQSELTGFEKGVPTISRIIFLGRRKFPGRVGGKTGRAGANHQEQFGRNEIIYFRQQSFRGLRHPTGKIVGPRLAVRAPGSRGRRGPFGGIAGLQNSAGPDGNPPLVIRVKQTSGTTNLAAPDVKKWVTRAVVLAVALLLLPYAEALLLKPHLAKKVSAFKTDAARLTVIDHELDFLQYLKQNQPPYLDALFVFAKSAPAGTRFDALSMNSHGEVSLRGSFRDGQQVADFRGKLIDSGFFANVTVEEQTPTPDRQKVNVRISGQWKPAGQLQSLAIGPTAEEIEKAKTATAAPAGPMPPGFPPAPPMAMPSPGKGSK